MRIVTNHHWRNFLTWWDLPESIQADFDYLEDPESGAFIKYHGVYYDLGEFMVAKYLAPEWSGFHGVSCFSCVAIKLSADCEQYKIATVIS